jgi:hypothetical protein
MALIHVAVVIRRVDSVSGAYQAAFLVATGATDSMAPTSELERIGITRSGTKPTS